MIGIAGLEEEGVNRGENGVAFLGDECPAFDDVCVEEEGGGDEDALGEDAALGAVASAQVEDFVGVEFSGEGDEGGGGEIIEH